MKTANQLALALIMALPMLASFVSAQVQLGEKLSVTGGGSLSAGYNGGYGSSSSSSHGLDWGGTGNVNGSYYNPNFFSFSVAPYFNQSRENSSYQSISNSSGVSANAAIFSGSQFPLSVNYYKSYNSSGNYAVPGVADYTTHGNSDSFSIGWDLNLDDLPSLSLTFLKGSSHYSIYGANSDSTTNYHAFNAHSSYRVAGFALNGTFTTSASNSESPRFLTGQSGSNSESDGHSYSFGVSHSLPLTGNISTNFSRSIISSDFSTSKSNGTLDSVNVNTTFSPVSRFNFGLNLNYNDNLAATLQQILQSSGATVPLDISQKSDSLDLSGYSSYAIPAINLTLMASMDHREQTFGGTSSGSESYTASATHFRTLLGGRLNATLGINRNTNDNTDSSTTGMMTTLGYTRRFAGWEGNGSFNYSRNTQSLLVGYSSSSYGFSGGLSHRLTRKLSWNSSASLSKSESNGANSSTSHSKSVSTSLSSRWLSASGTYSKSDGNSILTNSGLITGPTNVPIQTLGQLILYGGHSYGFGLGSAPTRGLTLAATYSKSITNTQGGSATSSNTFQFLNATMQYKFRKLWINTGYSRLTQGFSATGLGPTTVVSYYGGISRWFNLF